VRYIFDFERGSDHIDLEIYDWDKTVIIRKLVSLLSSSRSMFWLLVPDG